MHLLHEAPKLATIHGVDPEELILGVFRLLDALFATDSISASYPISVTGTSYEQMYKIHRESPHFPQFHHRPMGGMHNMHGFGAQPGFHSPSHFGHQHGFHGGSPYAPAQPPVILYLFTSSKEGFEPYWSQSPMGSPPGIPNDHRYGMMRRTDDW